MNLDAIEFAVSAPTLTDQGITFSKIAIYENGVFIRFARLTPGLLEAIQKKGFVRTNLASLEEMIAKQPELQGLIDALSLEK